MAGKSADVGSEEYSVQFWPREQYNDLVIKRYHEVLNGNPVVMESLRKEIRAARHASHAGTPCIQAAEG